MKKKIIIVLLVLLGIYGLFLIGVKVHYGFENKSVMNRLEGEIHYLERVDGNLVLMKSNANLTNKEVLYNHAGLGETNSGQNHNVIDYEIQPETNEITVIAMYDNEWSRLKVEQGVGTYYGPEEYGDTSYDEITKLSQNNVTVELINGSIYLTKNNEKTCIKDIGNNYDQNYNSYYLSALSPDGRYLIYTDMRNSLIISFLDALVPWNITYTYVMDLETNEVSPYRNISDITWMY